MRVLPLLVSLAVVACSAIPGDLPAGEPPPDGESGRATRREPGDGAPVDLAVRLDALVASYAGPDTPGLAIGLVRDGELVATSLRGLANLEHRVPVTPRTRFHIASVSKQFTGYAVQLLIERGALALTDRVGDHLPDMPACVAGITIGQLLHHTSGLRQTLRLQALAGRRSGRLLTQAAALDLIRSHRELNFEPGTEYGYSNANYIVLATIIEAVTGVGFAAWMQDEVFSPLGLEHTLIVDSYWEIVPERARSYSRDGDGFRHDSGLFWVIYGGTGVHTNLADLARWVTFLMDPPPAAADVVRAMQAPGTLADGTQIHYASGLEIAERRGLRQFAHGGTGDGNEAYVTFYPSVGVGAVLLENAPLAPSNMAARAAVDLLLDRIDGVLPSKGSGPAPADDAPPQFVPEELCQRIVGRFVVLDGSEKYAPGCLVFEREGDGIVLAGSDGDRLPLVPAGPGRLVGRGIPLEFEFPAGDTSITSMTFRLPGRVHQMRRIGSEDEAATGQLAVDCVGRYHSPEIDSEFEVVPAGDALVLRHAVHGDIALEHVLGDAFETDRDAIRWIHFERDEQGVVRGFRLTNHNERVRRLWFERTSGLETPATEAGR